MPPSALALKSDRVVSCVNVVHLSRGGQSRGRLVLLLIGPIFIHRRVSEKVGLNQPTATELLNPAAT